MTASDRAGSASIASSMKIQITQDGAVIATGTLDNNDSARDLAAMLPLGLTLKDYAATEKIADLPGPLSTTTGVDSGKPMQHTALAGDHGGASRELLGKRRRNY